MSADRLLTAAELGELLGLATATVLDRFERGDLPGFRLFGRKGGPVRFRLSEIEAALEGWRVGEAGGATTRRASDPGGVARVASLAFDELATRREDDDD